MPVSRVQSPLTISLPTLKAVEAGDIQEKDSHRKKQPERVSHGRQYSNHCEMRLEGFQGGMADPGIR